MKPPAPPAFRRKTAVASPVHLPIRASISNAFDRSTAIDERMDTAPSSLGDCFCARYFALPRARVVRQPGHLAVLAARRRARNGVRRSGVIARQLDALMQTQGLTKSGLAKRMKTSRAQLDRLLDPDNESVTLATLTRAAQAVGRNLRMELV